MKSSTRAVKGPLFQQVEVIAVGPPDYLSGEDVGIARYEGITAPPVLIEWIVEDVVEDLVVPGLVNNGEGNSLQKSLQASIQQVDKGNGGAAINQLQAFINKLDAKVNAGTLTLAEVQPLIDMAEYAISLISPGP